MECSGFSRHVDHVLTRFPISYFSINDLLALFFSSSATSGPSQALEPFKTTSSYVQHVLIITAIWRRHCRRGQQSNKSTIKLQPVLSVFNERGNLRRVRLRLEKFNRVGKSTSVVAGAPSWASKLPICCSTKELSD